MAAIRMFPFRFEPLYARIARPFGVTPGNSRVELEGDEFRARCGPWKVATSIANIADWSVSGPYRLLKTVGPAHLSLADHGLTFASNRERGLCVRFHEPISGMDPWGRLRHPGLTVTVADADRLSAELETRRG